MLFVERPALLVATLSVFAFCTTLGALRWRLLLRLADVHLSVRRAVQLTFTALFFNVVVPGNIGGDIVKSLYVARDAPLDKRASVFAIAFLDRLLALAGLVVVGVVLTLAQGLAAWEDPGLRELSSLVVVLMFVTLVAPIVLLVIIRRSGKRLEAWTQSTTRIGMIRGQLIAVARLVAVRPRILLAALGLAITVHLTGITLFATLATAITDQDVSVSTIASVYPVGILSMMLPISHAGFGVGHLAFDKLFALVGLHGGATVLNVYLIGVTTPALLGVFPYLLLRREAAPPTEAELAATGGRPSTRF